MVDADHIVKVHGLADAPAPPAVTVLGVARPVIKRVAPELPFVAEQIGGHSGHQLGMAILIHLKKLGMAPDIH